VDGQVVEVPALARQRALAAGSVGERWLGALPEVVTTLAERWQLRLGQPYGGGTASYVVAATDGVGRPCVLKVAMPLDAAELVAFDRSVLVHQLAAGRGCAELLAHDRDAPAMLLERLGPNLDDLGLPLTELLSTVATALGAFWQPVDPGVELPTGAEHVQRLGAGIVSTWEQLGRPCRRDVIDLALVCCDDRAAACDPARAVLVHGDAHGWNTLAAGGGFKLVDPEGVRSEPAHDLGVPMREYNEPLIAGDTARLVRERAEQLAAWCDVDPHAVWQWGFIERVSTGLANLRDFEGDGGALFLEVAARSR
jgi:streptomycin 6-kinase